MMNASVKNLQGQETGKVELPSAVFEAPEKPVVMREVLNAYLANQRQGTASTKTRGLVRGGGRKPWRQKHTGRARHGSIRTNIWRGGGVTFGPLPRDYTKQVPRKKRRAALRSALSFLAKENQITVVEAFDLGDAPKTKAVIAILDAFDLAEQKVLFVTDVPDEILIRSARNLPNVKVSVCNNLNIFDLLYHDHVVLSRPALEKIQETFGT
jgi:large subunit ribosomal protein L4